MKEGVKTPTITIYHLVEASNFLLVGKKEPKHPSHLVCREGDAMTLSRPFQTASKLGYLTAQVFKKVISLYPFERCHAGSHRHGVSRQSARLIDGPFGCEVVHNLCPSSEGTYRHTSPDYFAKAGQVRGYTKEPLGGLRADPKTGHHLVKNQ